MDKVDIVAIDLGKHSFHVHAQDDRGRELYHKKFNRAGIAKHLANHEPCTVAMEACGGSHSMAREIARFGHQPKRSARKKSNRFISKFKSFIRLKNDGPKASSDNPALHISSCNFFKLTKHL